MSTTTPAETWEGEANLVARLRSGDAQAWETVVRRHGGAMLGAARRIAGSEEDARCSVQSAFLKALTAIHGFRGGSLLSTWLHRIAVNEALMRIRARSRRPEISIESLLPQFHDKGAHLRPVEPWPEAERRLLQKETRVRVRECIERLPADYRTVLVLRDVEELETTEVAAMLDITPNAVRIRLHRARMALRTLLEPFLAPSPTPSPGTREPSAGAGGKVRRRDSGPRQVQAHGRASVNRPAALS